MSSFDVINMCVAVPMYLVTYPLQGLQVHKIHHYNVYFNKTNYCFLANKWYIMHFFQTYQLNKKLYNFFTNFNNSLRPLITESVFK